MANMMAKADELRNALARVDRNGDGLLNFDEFKRGLRGLGVQLPDQELVKIWHEASSQEVGKPAGRPTFQGPLPGADEEMPRSAKKVVKAHPETVFQSNLGEAFKVSDGAATGGLEGLHSHRKVGFKGCGNSATRLKLTDGSLTTKDLPAERRRNNLEPASSLAASVPHDQDMTTSPTRSQTSRSTAASSIRGALDFGPDAVSLPKELSSPDYVNSFNARALEGQWLQKGNINLAVAGPRLVQQVHERRAKLRNLARNAGTAEVDYSTFLSGVQQVGLIMGDEDSRRLWAAAGGVVGRQGEVTGEIHLARFLDSLENVEALERDFGKKSMSQQGYLPHMMSSLSKGYNVDAPPSCDSEHTTEKIGPMRRATVHSRPPDTPGFLEFQDAASAVQTDSSAAPSSKGSPHKGSPGRWTKIEEIVRAGLKDSTKVLHSAFGVTSSNSEGRKMSFKQLKGALNACGFPMSDTDFELMWRRLDNECLGQVGYADMMKSFDVYTPEVGRALPHLQSENAQGAQQHQVEEHIPAPSASEQQRREDRVTLSQLQRNPDALHRVRRAVGTRKVREDEFQRVITDAGIILSDTDTHLLFSRVADADGDDSTIVSIMLRYTNLSAIESVLQPLQNIVAPNKTQSVLGFGTGSKLQKTKGRTSKFKGHFGEDDATLREIYYKVSKSAMGHPNRLRQLFRKYDVDRDGQVSKDEFLSALLSHNIPISRDEALFLSQIADTEDRGLVSYEGFISVVGNVGASSKDRPQTALTEKSAESINNSVRGRKASVSSQNSVSSVRSNMSVRSERSTSSFASSVSGVARERSGFLLDGSLRDQERRAHRATALEVPIAARTPAAPAPPQAHNGRILHLAAPAPRPSTAS